MPPRKDLGSILVDENVIGQKDLDRVERERKSGGKLDGKPLWAALLDSKLTTDDELFFLLAQRFGAPVLAEEVIAETKMPASEQIRRALTREQALEGGILPIDLAADGNRVTVVMIDPSDEATLAAFLTRAQVPEGRAHLGRRVAIERAIDRCYGVAPKSSKPRLDVTGTVKLDPELAAEIERLPARVLSVEPLTPPPPASPNDKRRARLKTPQPVSPTASVDEAQRLGDERFTRALIQAVEALALELEQRVGTVDEPGRVGRPGNASTMARLARRVARQMGVGKRAAEEIGIAAQLYALDALLQRVDRNDGSPASDLFGDLGWPAAGEGGLVPILKALTAASQGFGRPSQGAPPLGARIISVVADYLELGAAAGEADLDTVSQLLRASTAGAPVVDALLRVLELDKQEDRTPSTVLSPVTGEASAPNRLAPERSAPSRITGEASGPTRPNARMPIGSLQQATSLLKPEAEDDSPTPEPRPDDLTQKKVAPTQRQRREPPQE
jgi:hypothetical protein